jgi:hypothetical protein
MQVTFNETIDITIDHNDEIFTRITRGNLNGKETGDTWLSMPLDTAIKLHEQLGQTIEEGKAKLNHKLAQQYPELVAKETTEAIESIEKARWENV